MDWTEKDTKLVEKTYPGLLFAKKEYNYITPKCIIELVSLFEKETGQSYNDIGFSTRKSTTFNHQNQKICVGSYRQYIRYIIKNDNGHKKITNEDLKKLDNLYPQILRNITPTYISKANDCIEKN